MSCNISIPMEDIIEAVQGELAKEFISIDNGVGNNTTLNSPNIKGDVTFDSAARDALCSALAECVDEKLKALEDELDGKIEDTEAALSQAIADAKEDLEDDIDLLRKSFEDSQEQQDAAFDAKIAAQKELFEQAIAAGDDALGARIDNLDGKVDHQREDLEKAIEAGDDALGARIDNLDNKVDHQREDLEQAITAGDEVLDTRIDALDGKVDHQREDLENAIAAGDAALGARIDNLGDIVSSEVSASKITSVTRVSDTVTIKLASGAEYPFSITDETLSKDRPVNFAPSHDGKNIEITLADGSVLDMTRDEFADWLSGEDSTLATDDELAALKEELNQSFLDELNSRLESLEHDQAVITSDETSLILTNDDGSKSKVELTNLIKLSSDSGNLLEVRDNGLYYGTEAPPDLAKFYVDAEAGSDENEGTTATSPFRTLSKALKSSPSNLTNTIYLKATTRNGLQQSYDWDTNHTVSGGATRRIQTYGQYHYNDSVMSCIKSKVAGGVGINYSEEWVRPILRPVWVTSSNPLRVQGFSSVNLNQGNIDFNGVTFDINKSNIDTNEYRAYQEAFVRGSGAISLHSCRIIGNTDNDALGVYAKLYLADTGSVISISSRNTRVLSVGDEDPLTTPSLRGLISLAGRGNGSVSYDDNYFQGLGITKEKILECGVPQAIVDNTNFVGGNIGTFFRSKGFISGVVTHSNGTPLNLSSNFEIK